MYCRNPGVNAGFKLSLTRFKPPEVQHLFFASGARINSYNLGGYSSSAVLPPGQLSVVQMNATLASGLLYAQFTLQLQQTAAELAAGVPIM